MFEQSSFNVKPGDQIKCTIAELQKLRAVPENIPLDIVYEDEHVLVINKPAHMVIPNLTRKICEVIYLFNSNSNHLRNIHNALLLSANTEIANFIIWSTT